MKLVLASANEGKQREFAALLAPSGVTLVLQSELGVESIAETGTSFEENALLKARHAARETALPALADDSGLEVDALGGRPGVFSARYAGAQASAAENNSRLLAELASLPETARGARYRCVLALVRTHDDPEPLIARGVWDGRIATVAAGSGGFGYDPLFVPQGHAESVALMPPTLKNALSHRAEALADLIAQLRLRPLAARTRP